MNQDSSYDSTVYADYTDAKANTSNKTLVTCYLYAKWIPNKVYITYNVQGGTIGNGYTVKENGHVLSGNNLWFHTIEYGKSADPYNDSSFGMKKTGYRFGGWKVRSSGVILDQDKVYDSTMYVDNTNYKLNTSNTAEVWCYLDAVWIPNQVQIAYNPNGGTIESADYSINKYGFIAKDDTPYFHTVKYGNSSRPYKDSDFGLTRAGYQFLGWKVYLSDKFLSQSTSYDSTVYTDRNDIKVNTSNTNYVTCYLYAEWKPITYTNSLHHWFYGLKKKEGNNGTKQAYKIRDDYFDAAYGTKYIMGKDRAIKAPHGYFLDDYVGAGLLKWETHKLGCEITQAEQSFWFEYTYHPYDYNISYQLNGGINHPENPDSYTVLYGVNLKDPSKTGYLFTGWESELFFPKASDVVAQQGAKYENGTITIGSDSYDSIRLRVLNGSYEKVIATYAVGEKLKSYNTPYVHTLPTGNYTLCIDAKNGDGEYEEAICFKKLFLTKEMSYSFSFNAERQRILNLSIQPKEKKTTGVNPGKGVPVLSSTEVGENFFFQELATRQIGDTGFVANWKPIQYTIVYDGNDETGGSTPSSLHIYDKAQSLTPNGFEKDGSRFVGWNTKKDGSGTSYRDKEEVKNLSTKDGSVITLYAQWVSTDYNIIYKGNGATSGTEKTQEYSQKKDGYITKTNKGYTDFEKTNHTFVGWYPSSVVDTKEKMNKVYKEGSTLSLLELQMIHEDQVKKGIVKENASKAKDIILYAVWDEAPQIDTSALKKDRFYEGVDVTCADLLDGITAKDLIDGSLNSEIKIVRIDYSAGKLVNGKKQEAYSKVWENGMPEDEKLDTWFMQLDKNDSPVKHIITYQVKDSAGNVVTAKKEIKVIYNEFPEIRVNDLRYELKYAQAGKITKEELLEKAIESGALSSSDIEDGDMNSKIELLDFDADAFKTMKREGFIPITYKVQDSMGPNGKGKVTLKTVNVNIFVRHKAKTAQYVRFINKKYYEINANLDRDALRKDPKQVALLSVNGGLHPFSVWYEKDEYRELITATFEKTTGTTYTYTREDVQKMR